MPGLSQESYMCIMRNFFSGFRPHACVMHLIATMIPHSLNSLSGVSIEEVVNFFAKLHSEGYKYQSLNAYHSAIILLMSIMYM